MPNTEEWIVPVKVQVDDSQLQKLQKNGNKNQTELQKSVQNMIDGWQKGIHDLLRGAFDFGAYFDKIRSKFNRIVQFDVLLTSVQKIKNSITLVTSQIWNGFKKGATGVASIIDWFKNKLKQTGLLIGKQLARDISGPLNQFVSWFKANKKQITEAMSSLAQNIGHLLSSFAQGLIAIVKVGRDFFKWFDTLPNSIKGATYAILAMWAVLKAGPIGVLSAIVALAGDLVKDYSNYQKNKANGALDQNAPNHIGVALAGIWQIVDSDVSAADKAFAIGEKLMDSLLEGITNWLKSASSDMVTVGTDIVDWLCDKINTAFGFVTGTLTVTDQRYIKLSNFLTAFTNFLTQAISLAFTAQTSLASTIVSNILQMFADKKDEDWKKVINGIPQKDSVSFAALGNAIIAMLFTGDPSKAVVTGLLTFVGKMFKVDQNGKFQYDPDYDLLNDLEGAAKAIMLAVFGAMEKVQWIGSGIFSSIATVIANVFGADSLQSAFQANPQIGSDFISAIAAAIGASALGASPGLTLVAAIFGLISSSIKQAIQLSSEDGNLNWDKFWKNLGVKIGQHSKEWATFGKALAGTVIQLFTKFNDFGGIVIDWFMQLLNPNDDYINSDQYKKAKVGWAAIIDGLITGILTGNTWVGIGTTLFSVLGKALDDAKASLFADKNYGDLTSDEWKKLFGASWQNLKETGKAMWGQIVSGFTGFMEWFNSDQTQADLKKISSDLSNWWNGYTDDDGNVVKGFKEHFQWLFNWIKDTFVSVFSGLWQLISPHIRKLAQIIGYELYNGLPSWFKDILHFAEYKGVAKPTFVDDNGDGKYTIQTYGEKAYTVEDRTNSKGQKYSDWIQRYSDYFYTDDTGVHLDPTRKGQFAEEWRQDTIDYWNQLAQVAFIYGDYDMMDYLTSHADDLNWQVKDIAPFAVWNARLDTMDIGEWKNKADNYGYYTVTIPDIQDQAQQAAYINEVYDHLVYLQSMDFTNPGFFDPYTSEWVLYKHLIENGNIEWTQMYLDKVLSQWGFTIDQENGATKVSEGVNAGTAAYDVDSGTYPTYIVVSKDQVRREVEDSLSESPFKIKLQAEPIKVVHGGSPSGNYSYAAGDSANTGFPKGSQSQGGRITSAGRHLIGQDGTQYVIPITKPTRAAGLIAQMVSQMGYSARSAVMAALGLDGGESTIGGSMLNGAPISGTNGGNIVYNNNVSAPVTINVQSSGADAKSIGQHVYSSAQRALLRTIQTAVG